MRINRTSPLLRTFIIGMLPFIMVIGNSLFLPLIPDIQQAMNLTSFQGGLILTVFSIPAALLIPFIGLLSDRVGRKVVIQWSLFFIMVGSLLSALAPMFFTGEVAFFLFLAGRFFQGVGAGGTTPMAMALVADLFDGKNRSQALGTLEVFNSIGKVISPILGALLAVIIWYSTFYFYFLIALLTWIGMFYMLKGKERQSVMQTSFSTYIKNVIAVFIKEFKWIMPIFFATGVGLFILFGMLFFLSFELEAGYQILGIEKGIYMAIPLTALTIFSYWSGKRIGTDKNKMKRFIFLGLVFFLFAFSGLIFLHDLVYLIIFLIIGSAGLGLFLPAANTAVTSSVGPEERGLIVSLYNMIRFFGVALGPMFYSIWMRDVLDMFFMSMFLIGISVVFILIFWTCIPILKDCAYQSIQ